MWGVMSCQTVLIANPQPPQTLGGLHLGKRRQYFSWPSRVLPISNSRGAREALHQLDHPCYDIVRKARKQKKSQCAGLALPLTLLSSWAVCFLAKKDDKVGKKPRFLSLLQNSSLLLLISETWAARHISEDERHALQMCCSCKRCIIQKVTPLSHIVIFIQIAGVDPCYFTLSRS